MVMRDGVPALAEASETHMTHASNTFHSIVAQGRTPQNATSSLVAPRSPGATTRQARQADSEVGCADGLWHAPQAGPHEPFSIQADGRRPRR